MQFWYSVDNLKNHYFIGSLQAPYISHRVFFKLEQASLKQTNLLYFLVAKVLDDHDYDDDD